MSESKVSVVVTHFNRPALAIRAIRSALNAAAEIGELLIVDDCSHSDEYEQLTYGVRQLGSENTSVPIRITRQPVNGGANRARNEGIKLARFPFVAFLDCDDEWVDGKLRAQLDFVAREGLDFAGTQFEEFNGGDSRILPRRPPAHLDYASYIFLFGGHFLTSTLLVKKEVASKVMFREELRKFQDWEYAIRLGALGYRGGILMRPLTIYHAEHSGRISSEISLVKAREFYECVEELIRPKARLAFKLRALPRMHMKLGRNISGFATILSGLLFEWRGILPLLMDATRVRF